jgi:hypothetical protein
MTRVKAALVIAFLVIPGFALAEPEVQSLRDIYQSGPNKIADIPAHWDVDNPVELQVLFNLTAPVNSPEADDFLSRYVKFLKSLPDKMTVKVSRVVAPGTYSYVTRLSFDNWHDYQVYEKSAAFRKYYYGDWKPNVSNAEELLTLTDLQATNSR